MHLWIEEFFKNVGQDIGWWGLVISAFCGSVITEFGWATYLTPVFRQVVWWKFENRSWVFMFVLNFSILFVFAAINGGSLFVGGEKTGNDTFDEFQYTSKESIEEEMNNVRDSIWASFEGKKLELRDQFDIQKHAINNSASSDTVAYNERIKWLEDKELRKENLYPTEKYKAKREISKIMAGAMKKIYSIDSLYAVQKDILFVKRDTIIASAMKPFELKLSRIAEVDVKRKNLYDTYTGVWYWFIMLFAGASYFGYALLVLSKEVYIKITQQGLGDYVHNYRVGFASNMVTDISTGLYESTETGYSMLKDFVRLFRIVVVPVKMLLENLNEKIDELLGVEKNEPQTTSKPVGNKVSEDSSGSDVGKEIRDGQYVIIIQDGEPQFDHTDNNGAVVKKNITDCQRSKGTYKARMIKAKKVYDELKAKGASDNELLAAKGSLDHKVKMYNYWLGAEEALKKAKKNG